MSCWDLSHSLSENYGMQTHCRTLEYCLILVTYCI